MEAIDQETESLLAASREKRQKPAAEVQPASGPGSAKDLPIVITERTQDGIPHYIFQPRPYDPALALRL